ncbi:MAG TPA: tRNA lysidine(34) synthetase TilS [Azospirillaceae bacterium]|nr:tRNA lysidine(34) synthetase TilS [Azospirillaceae bacterium]
MVPESPPLGPEAFAALMARLGPFESQPHVAVGVSGGADSLALTLLLHDWARARSGAVLALTVDHGLRPESADEGRQVAGWLAARGISHEILSWTGDKPRSGVQAAAREARYRLIEARCRDAGILHLALAHHRDDQAETVLLRLGKGSGVDGLSGMSLIRERPDVRILRPLLTVPSARLRATCHAYAQEWLEDPSNRSPRFTRARLRGLVQTLTGEGVSPEGLVESARRAARVRATLEGLVAGVLGEAASVHPEGYLWLDPAPLLAAPAEVGLRALARALTVVGGAVYAPRLERLERLYAHVTAGDGRGRTLAGCRILPRRGRLLLCRESEAAAEATPLQPGNSVWWDRRFTLRLERIDRRGQVWVARLGEAGWASIRSEVLRLVSTLGTPVAVVPSLPALWDEEGVLAAPHLGFVRGGAGPVALVVTHTPAETMAGPVFAVV